MLGLRCQGAGVRPPDGTMADCYDNATHEIFFATLGCAVFDQEPLRSQVEACMALPDVIEWMVQRFAATYCPSVASGCSASRRGSRPPGCPDPADPPPSRPADLGRRGAADRGRTADDRPGECADRRSAAESAAAGDSLERSSRAKGSRTSIAANRTRPSSPTHPDSACGESGVHRLQPLNRLSFGSARQRRWCGLLLYPRCDARRRVGAIRPRRAFDRSRRRH